jgi:hypothetical protein
MRRIFNFSEYINEGYNKPWINSDVTKMPILGRVILKKIGDIESEIVPFVSVIREGDHIIFIGNTWYKEHKGSPHIYLKSMIDGVYWDKWKKIK